MTVKNNNTGREKIDEETLLMLYDKHGYKINEIEKVTTGKFNKIFIGKSVQKSGKIILRIAPPEDAGFIFYEKHMMAREPEIHRIVKDKTSLPVPEIYVYDNDRDIINRDFLLMEFMPGTPLSEKYLNSKKKEKVMYCTGSYLRELHDNCQQKKYGYPGKCMQMKTDWKSAYETMWEYLIADLENCGVYNEEEAIRARECKK